ncbi:MAG TPA: OFA family MFS transporter [Candidatus Deferrimicrobiaceae bacterium]|nr:OFA family MFS transporter [Candidatus Deferrimicrobiaceae bacterium]
MVTPNNPSNQPKVMNRWVIVVGGILIQLALGAIYAWSAFTGPLQGTATAPSEFGFTKTETQIIFSVGLLVFAIFTIIGGRLQGKLGPMKVAMIGGTLLGLGYILASFMGVSFIGKLIFIGVLAGAGIGLAYVVPIATAVKWFPDKKGLVSGLAVAGFGFGAFIWFLLANPPSILGFRGLIALQAGAYTVANVDFAFLVYGIIFLILVLAGSLTMRNPPAGWKPAGWVPPQTTTGKASAVLGCRPKEMLRRKSFYILWVMFLVGALAGLMVIGNVQNFAKDTTDGFTAYGFSSQEAIDFAVIGAAVCLPIFNGAGRIVWGQVSDRIGRGKALIGMFAFQAVMMAVFFYTTSNPILFYVTAALIGFNFGGNFALFPVSCADSFGPENLAVNYGFLFTAYGIGGIVGPILAGMVQDAGLSFLYAFIPAAAMCAIAVGLAFAYQFGSRKIVSV